ncbi:leucine-rich repeat domain-containing protein [Primorskyibacter sp. 2E233]|uniref:leucine-rich repeat domain-containing protein n=1 Tax=Primorskyibacter sp. 2E233 TaxID=3413431 RepID=UPI003BF205F6
MRTVFLTFALWMLAAPLAAQQDCVEFLGKCHNTGSSYVTVKLRQDGADLSGIGVLDWAESVELIGPEGQRPPVSIAALANLPNLNNLRLENLTVSDPGALGELQVEDLGFKSVSADDFSGLARVAQLRKLRFVNVSGLPGLKLANLPPLVDLTLVDTPLPALDGLERLTDLQSLVLANTGATDLSAVAALNLRRFIMRGERLDDLSMLSGSPNLAFLVLNGSEVTSLDSLPHPDSLMNLSALDSALEDISALSVAKKLRNLDLRGSKVADVTGIHHLPLLEELDLRETPVSDLSPLANLRALKKLWLTDTKVADLGPLAGLPSIEQLSISGIPATQAYALAALDKVTILWMNHTRVGDLKPLLDMDALQALRIDDEKMVARERLEQFIAQRVLPE